MDLPRQMFKVSINLTESANEDCYFPDCPPLCPPVSSPPAPTIIKYVPPGNHSNNQTLSPLVIIIVCIFASSFLLVCCYVILLKLFSRWNLQRRPPRENNDTHDELEENQNSFNQFWYIRTVGLDESIINSIAICRYKKDEGLIDGTECSVCLNEFRDSENLRLLPKCSHAFHIPCIDTWLKSHVNCPLCRANIVCNPPPNSSSSSDHTLSDQVQAETENNIGSDDQATATEVIPEANDVTRERDIVLLETGCSYSPSTANSPFPILGDLATENQSQETDMIDEIQPTRRSVSMDDYSSSMICLDLAGLHRTSSTGSSTAQKSSTDHKRFNFGEFPGLKAIILKHSANHSNFKQLGDVHRGPSLQKGPIAMKRSFSSSSKFFLSRYSRSRNSSVLPL